MFWVRDSCDKSLLIRHGAHPGFIYDRHELALLIGRGYCFSELQVAHTAKVAFAGRINDPQ